MQQFEVQGEGTSEGTSGRTGGIHLFFGVVVVGIVLAILLEVIVQLLPPHYNPISQSESDLAIGPYGLLINIDFFIRGVLPLIFLGAFMSVIPREAQSRSGIILMGISAIGKIIIAFFVTDLTARPQTIHGTIHAVAALLSFFCGALGELLLARSLRHDPNVRPSAQRFLVGWASVTLVWSVIVIATVFVSTQIGVWGLLERIFTILFLSWMVIASLNLWNYPSLRGVSGLRTKDFA